MRASWGSASHIAVRSQRPTRDMLRFRESEGLVPGGVRDLKVEQKSLGVGAFGGANQRHEHGGCDTGNNGRDYYYGLE